MYIPTLGKVILALVLIASCVFSVQSFPGIKVSFSPRVWLILFAVAIANGLLTSLVIAGVTKTWCGYVRQTQAWPNWLEQFLGIGSPADVWKFVGMICISTATGLAVSACMMIRQGYSPQTPFMLASFFAVEGLAIYCGANFVDVSS